MFSIGPDADEPVRSFPGVLRRLGALALAVLLASCASSASAGPDAVYPPEAPAPPSRPADGLLTDASLQEVVDRQTERDTDALLRLLSGDDPRVRARAAFALASVQDAFAVSYLAERLGDSDASVRADVAFALGQSAGENVARLLLDALDEESDPRVRRHLLEAVGKIGEEDALTELVESDLPEADTANAGAPAYAVALTRFGMRGITTRPAVTWLLDALTAPSDDLREEAAYFFGRIGSAVPWLDRADRVRAALDGYERDDPAAMHLLGALGRGGDPYDRERIQAWMLDAADWRIRTVAAQALSAWRNEAETRDALFEALDDSSAHVAITAARSLTTNVTASAAEVDRLVGWIDANPDRWRVVVPLLTALAGAGRSDYILDWMERWPDDAALPRSRALGSLVFVGGEAVDSAFMDAARSDESTVRSAAVQGLTRRWLMAQSDPSAAARFYEVFAGALASDDPVLVQAAATTLADPAFAPLGAYEALVDRYRTSSPPEDLDAMVAILQALSRAQENRDVVEPVLEEALSSDHVEIRRAASTALASLTGRSVVVQDDTASSPSPSVDWGALRDLGPRPALVLETEEGRIALVLESEEAPLTVQTIARLAQDGEYDGVPFHRVVPNFVIQGGDFTRGDGLGDPGFTLRTEVTQIPFLRGVVAMASAGTDTEGSQFFIHHSRQRHLHGGYTTFGWVVEGQDVVDRIQEGVLIESARVVPDPAASR